MSLAPEREAGIASSAAHAEADQPGWMDQAVSKVTQYALHIAPTGDLWHMEQARLWAYANGLSVPTEQRAWGAVSRRLIKAKVIVACGYANDSYGSPKPIYQKVLP